jgi:hypothetical protein
VKSFGAIRRYGSVVEGGVTSLGSEFDVGG